MIGISILSAAPLLGGYIEHYFDWQLVFKVLLISPIAFGWCAALVGFCYFFGSYVNSKFVLKVGTNKMIGFGSICVLLGGIIMLVPYLLFHYLSVMIFIAPLMLMSFGTSFIIANAYAEALRPYGKIAGAAVAIMGTIQMTGGVITSSLISWSADKNQLPLGLIITVSGILLLFSFWFRWVAGPRV